MNKIFYPALLFLVLGLVSCDSNDEPEKQRYNLTDAALNKHLPALSKIAEEEANGNYYLGDVEKVWYQYMAVIPSEGEGRYYNSYTGMYELPGRGGEYTITLVERDLPMKPYLRIYEDVDTAPFESHDQRATVAMHELADKEAEHETELNWGFKPDDPELYGVSTELYFKKEINGEIRRCTRYRFPANETGKVRMFVFLMPDFRPDPNNRNYMDFFYDRYFFLQYPD